MDISILFEKNADGSLTRLPAPFPENPASSEPSPSSNPFHLSKDIVINQSKNTWVRLFLPQMLFKSNSGEEQRRLPVVIYFHGGGFIICSPATTGFYKIYDGLTTGVGPAIVVSVKYRLAPEHRLPAAYDDAFEALHWIKNSSDEWLTKYGDVSRCYLMGTSAGGNICYHVGLRVAASSPNDLKPLQIKGLILHDAAFSGQKRSDSELRLENDKIISLPFCDMVWDLSLPVGSDRDHEYCNPMVGLIKKEIFDQIKILGWKILITGYGGDPLIDRQIELAKKLEELGVTVVTVFEEGGFHGFDISDPSSKRLVNLVKQFIQSP